MEYKTVGPVVSDDEAPAESNPTLEGNHHSGRPQARSAAVYALIAMHLVVALTPAGVAFRPNNSLTLPMLWALGALPFSQIMLLSIWLGFAGGSVKRKFVISVLAISFLTIWQTLDQVLNWWSVETTLNSIIAGYLKHTAIMIAVFLVLSIAMAGASRFMGIIRFANEADLRRAVPRSNYSLFALLAMSTVAALILGLARASHMSSAGVQSQFMIATYLMLLVMFAVILLTTVWATLGAGHVVRRLLVVLFVSVVLGLTMAVGVGFSLRLVPWWLFAAASQIMVLPTAIVAITLLVIRSMGLRLLPRQPALVYDRSQNEWQGEGAQKNG